MDKTCTKQELEKYLEKFKKAFDNEKRMLILNDIIIITKRQAYLFCEQVAKALEGTDFRFALLRSGEVFMFDSIGNIKSEIDHLIECAVFHSIEDDRYEMILDHYRKLEILATSKDWDNIEDDYSISRIYQRCKPTEQAA